MISVTEEIISVLYVQLSTALFPEAVCVSRGPWGGNVVTLVDSY